MLSRVQDFKKISLFVHLLSLSLSLSLGKCLGLFISLTMNILKYIFHLHGYIYFISEIKVKITYYKSGKVN